MAEDDDLLAETDDDALLVCLAAAFELFFALFDFFDQPVTSLSAGDEVLVDPKAAAGLAIGVPFCPVVLADLLALLLLLLRLVLVLLLRFIFDPLSLSFSHCAALEAINFDQLLLQ